MVRILIADDHAVVRHGLIRILTDEWPMAVYSQAVTIAEALQLSRTEPRWDVAVMDLNMPGGEGLEGLKALKHACPLLPILILSVKAEEQYAVRTLRAGAVGYLTKDSAPEELVGALRRILAGGRYISPKVADILADAVKSNKEGSLPHESLSDREFQILCAIGSGRTVSQIGDDLSLSVKTVSTYRTRILEKMSMKTNAELTHYAFQQHLVD